MATIHRTTLTPGKLEVVAGWLPAQPWYRGNGSPQLAKAGGFRLDDPTGNVGIEFAFVTDTADGSPVTYQLPVTYRGAPAADGAGLISTSEHGVLGLRWIYDAATDPVAVAQVFALLQGRAAPQHQSESDTPDPTVIASSQLPGGLGFGEIMPLGSTADITTIGLLTKDPEGGLGPAPALDLHRVLDPACPVTDPAESLGTVEADRLDADGERVRVRILSLRAA